MYGVVYNATDGDLELSSYAEGYVALGSWSYASKSISVGSEQASPQGLTFSPDGTKMLMVGASTVYQYTLSTAYDVSTASYDSISFAVTSQIPNARGVAFNNDGTAMFVAGNNGTSPVAQYTLSTAYDLSTASYSNKTFNVKTQELYPTDVIFNADGTSFYVIGSGSQRVFQYDMTTAFDVSTASYTSKNMGVSGQDTGTNGISWNADGTKLYLVGATNESIFEYVLTTAYDISTGSYNSVSFSVSAQDSAPTGIAFGDSGRQLYLLGDSNNSVFQYSTGSLAFPTGYHPVHTTASIDSTYWTDINSMTADQAAGDGNVYYVISTDDRTTWSVIDDTDGERAIVKNNAGTWQYNSNGTYASETWVNGATNTELATLAEAMGTAQNRMDKTQLDAVTDPNHIALSNDLDLAIVFNMTSGSAAPSSDGVAINYDANVLNKGAVLGTDYDFDAPTQNSVRITALASNNLKVRVV